MTPLPRYAVRALALNLTLVVAGAWCLTGPAPASAASSSPIGGRQLAAKGVIVNLAPGVPAPPVMASASYVIADMSTGQILAAKAPHALFLPASTLKTLTALTLIPRLPAKTPILAQPQDVQAGGSSLGILAGTSYSAGTLFQGLLMASGNDSAYALARGNHSVAKTLKEMNATAASLNAFDTVAKDPSGLDKAGQRSSAYDLALIGRAAMKLPEFRRYVIKKHASLPGGRSTDGTMKPGFKISSHNTLLFNYPGAIGIKSGYTNAARHTYIGAATRSGKTYIVTQMAAPSASWRPHAALLSWAFTYGPALTPIGELVAPGRATASTPTASAPKLVQAPAASTPSRPTPALSPRTATSGELAGDSSFGEKVRPGIAWAGAAGGVCALALVGVWARRKLRR